MQIMDDPYPENPKSQKWALDAVREKIDSWSVPPEFKALIRRDEESFIYKKTDKASSTTHFYGGQLGWKYWVVKNDELNLIGQLGPAAIAIVTFFAAATSPAVLAVGLVMSTLAIAQKFKNKGVSLQDEDYRILMVLRQAGPCAVSKLARDLSELHIFGSGVWDDARTLAALKKLQSVRQGDGSVTSLANEGSDGLWSVSGI